MVCCSPHSLSSASPQPLSLSSASPQPLRFSSSPCLPHTLHGSQFTLLQERNSQASLVFLTFDFSHSLWATLRFVFSALGAIVWWNALWLPKGQGHHFLKRFKRKATKGLQLWLSKQRTCALHEIQGGGQEMQQLIRAKGKQMASKYPGRRVVF